MEQEVKEILLKRAKNEGFRLANEMQKEKEINEHNIESLQQSEDFQPPQIDKVKTADE